MTLGLDTDGSGSGSGFRHENFVVFGCVVRSSVGLGVVRRKIYNKCKRLFNACVRTIPRDFRG